MKLTHSTYFWDTPITLSTNQDWNTGGLSYNINWSSGGVSSGTPEQLAMTLSHLYMMAAAVLAKIDAIRETSATPDKQPVIVVHRQFEDRAAVLLVSMLGDVLLSEDCDVGASRDQVKAVAEKLIKARPLFVYKIIESFEAPDVHVPILWPEYDAAATGTKEFQLSWIFS